MLTLLSYLSQYQWLLTTWDLTRVEFILVHIQPQLPSGLTWEQSVPRKYFYVIQVL